MNQKSAVFVHKLDRILFAAIAFVLVSNFPAGTISAQPVQSPQKANFELANKYTTEKLRTYVHDQSLRPQWLEKSDKFWYRFKTTSGVGYYLVDPEKKLKKPMFDHMRLAAELIQKTGKPFNGNDLNLQNLKFVNDTKAIEFEVDSLRYDYDLGSQTLLFKDSVKKKPDDSWVSYSPDSSVIVFAKNYNLFLMKANDKDSVETQVTTNGERYYSYGGSDDTTKNKRTRAGVVWSKDSKKFVTTREDERKVAELWLINSLSNPRPTLETYKYSMPGEKNVPQAEAMVYDRDEKKMTPIDSKAWIDQTLGGFQWTKTAERVFFTRRDREQHKVDICVAEASTGTVKVLFEERLKISIETKPLVVIDGGKEFLWYSLRDGWGHYYRYGSDGKLLNRVTMGPFMVDRVAAIDTVGRVAYMMCNGNDPGRDPYYVSLYRVNFDGSGFQMLTPEDATHQIDVSESRKYFVDNYSRVDEETKMTLRNNRGDLLVNLEETDLALLKQAGWKPPEVFKAKAADGITDIWGVMWKPYDFDTTRKYPIIANVYPGPQTESVPTTFSPTSGNVGLAQLGFIVITLGNRGGSPQRPLWYQEFGRGNLRDYGLDDKKAVIEQLAFRYNFIDINRVGIFGHSGGGFMTAAAMLVYPDFFKVGVASSGNHDNNVYNQWWGETHHGVEEVAGKKDSSLSWKIKIPTNPEIAANLKGHLLLVTGDVDNNVHPANTFRLVDALIKANKRFDFMILPGQRHGYGPDQPYFTRMLWNYFAEHLLGDYRTNVNMFEDVLDTKATSPAQAPPTEGRRRQ